MTLPTGSSAISLSQVNTELGYSSSATIDMNATALRTLFGVSGSGTTIDMNAGHGKSNGYTFNATLAAGTTTWNYNVRTAALAAGWNGTSVLYGSIILAGSTTIVGSKNSYPAFDTGSLPVGSNLTIVINGFIRGTAGWYSSGGAEGNGSDGSDGGTAINTTCTLTIQNNGEITAGGGGGGGGASDYGGSGDGGGGGWGAGYLPTNGAWNATGTSGAWGASGSHGGAGGSAYNIGGGDGSTGSTGGGGGGGGLGANGGYGGDGYDGYGGSGGTGGYAVKTNGNTINWTGTRESIG